MLILFVFMEIYCVSNMYALKVKMYYLLRA